MFRAFVGAIFGCVWRYHLVTMETCICVKKGEVLWYEGKGRAMEMGVRGPWGWV